MTGANISVASMGEYKVPTTAADLVIIGGGISGLLAAQQAKQRGISYILIDRADDLGGIWDTMSNNYSYLQVRATPCPASHRRLRSPGGPRPLRHVHDVFDHP